MSVDTPTKAPERRPSRAEFGRGFWVRMGLLGVLDALAIYSFTVLLTNQAWGMLASLVVGTAVINWVYLSPRTKALRWLTPGLALMAVFVVFPILYTFYVSLTNWATGNILSKGQVIESLESQTFSDPDSEGQVYDLFVYRDDATGDLRLYLRTAEGEVYFGTPRERSAEPLTDATEDPAALGTTDEDGDGVPDTIGPYRLLVFRDLFPIASLIESLVLDLPGGGSVTTIGVSQGRLVQSTNRYEYDEQADVLRDLIEGQDCVPDRGNFVCEDGTLLEPGWVVVIGAENFTNVATNERIRGPFVRVFVWNFVFALLSVLLTFGLGLILSLAMQHERLRGKILYRSIYILPYAVPAFLSILVWRGLLNPEFGQVNDLLGVFNISPVPWLTNGTWAKAAVLLVNTWLGFPYMYLITTGALQAIPAELQEAARVDGANGFTVFRRITFPLLMVSLAPLLIGSFAFNFNNFVLIFLLTNGGPPILNAAVPVGETDILISFTFDIAVQSGRGNNFGLGSAITIFIFFIVMAISSFSFRFTKRLEEIYGSL